MLISSAECFQQERFVWIVSLSGQFRSVFLLVAIKIGDRCDLLRLSYVISFKDRDKPNEHLLSNFIKGNICYSFVYTHLKPSPDLYFRQCEINFLKIPMFNNLWEVMFEKNYHTRLQMTICNSLGYAVYVIVCEPFTRCVAAFPPPCPALPLLCACWRDRTPTTHRVAVQQNN